MNERVTRAITSLLTLSRPQAALKQVKEWVEKSIPDQHLKDRSCVVDVSEVRPSRRGVSSAKPNVQSTVAVDNRVARYESALVFRTFREKTAAQKLISSFPSRQFQLTRRCNVATRRALRSTRSSASSTRTSAEPYSASHARRRTWRRWTSRSPCPLQNFSTSGKRATNFSGHRNLRYQSLESPRRSSCGSLSGRVSSAVSHGGPTGGHPGRSLDTGTAPLSGRQGSLHPTRSNWMRLMPSYSRRRTRTTAFAPSRDPGVENPDAHQGSEVRTGVQWRGAGAVSQAASQAER